MSFWKIEGKNAHHGKCVVDPSYMVSSKQSWIETLQLTMKSTGTTSILEKSELKGVARKHTIIPIYMPRFFTGTSSEVLFS
jgi:hypothetical protein